MIDIRIKTIPHAKQRYDTAGDYWEKKEFGKTVVHFRISAMHDTRYEQLVLIHELVEYFLVKLAGIDVKEIDAFDEAYEHLRGEDDDSEPGDDEDAPYYFQHQAASAVERLCAVMMGVNWLDYSNAVLSCEYGNG